MQRLTYLATRDELTGHLNRNALRAELAAGDFDAPRQESRHCAFLVASIDRLAMINDCYGFDAGEEVIVGVGERLARSLRASDIIGRTAGNKFGVILKNCNEREIAIVAEPPARRGARPGHRDPRRQGFGHHLGRRGVAAARRAATSQEAMLRAEEALERARANGRDGFAVYEAVAAARKRAPAPDDDGRRSRRGAQGQPPASCLSAHRRRQDAQDHPLRMPAAHAARRRPDRRRRAFHPRRRAVGHRAPGRPPRAGNGRGHAASAHQEYHAWRQCLGHGGGTIRPGCSALSIMSAPIGESPTAWWWS